MMVRYREGYPAIFEGETLNCNFCDEVSTSHVFRIRLKRGSSPPYMKGMIIDEIKFDLATPDSSVSPPQISQPDAFEIDWQGRPDEIPEIDPSNPDQIIDYYRLGDKIALEGNREFIFRVLSKCQWTDYGQFVHHALISTLKIKGKHLWLSTYNDNPACWENENCWRPFNEEDDDDEEILCQDTGFDGIIYSIIGYKNRSCLKILPTEYTFPEAAYGACPEHPAGVKSTIFELVNVGDQNLTLRSYAITAPAHFKLMPEWLGSPRILAPGSSAFYKGEFRPESVGGPFSHPFNINHDGVGDTKITCHGSSREALKVIQYKSKTFRSPPDSNPILTFGEYKILAIELLPGVWVNVPSPHERTVTLKNIGETDLRVETVDLQTPRHGFGFITSFTGIMQCGDKHPLTISMPGLLPPYGDLAYGTQRGKLLITTDASTEVDEIRLRGRISEGYTISRGWLLPIIILFIILGLFVISQIIRIPLP